MEPELTITAVLREHAERRGAETSHIFLPDGENQRGRLSFLELERSTEAVAQELALRGMRGERVALLYASGLEFIAAFFGCLAAGAVAVPIAPPRRAQAGEDALRIIRAAGARMILADAGTRDQIAALLGEARRSPLPVEVFPWLSDPAETAARAAGGPVHVPRGDDLAFLQFTSGSTGDPKGVAVSHANIAANQRAIRRGFRHGEDTVVVSWLPLHHDMGLVGMIMQPIYLGRPCVLMPPDAFVQRPIRWLKALSRHRATTSGGPTFGYRRCVEGISDADLDAHADLDLGAWRIAFAGAEPVRADQLDAFARRFARAGFDARAFYPCYGLAEATLMVTGAEASQPLVTAEVDAGELGRGRSVDAGGPGACRLVGCGRGWGDDEVAVVDPDTGMPVADDVVGEIWVTGPSVARGYWNRPAESEQCFAATSPARPGRRFLRTGDLGFLRGGELYITGRLKDLVILNGRNYYPQDIESTVVGLHPAFRPSAAVFADDELQEGRVILVQEVYPTRAGQLDVRAATELVAREVGAAHDIRLSEIYFTTSRLPVTTSGKIRRRACREAWRAGLLRPVRPGGDGAPHDGPG